MIILLNDQEILDTLITEYRENNKSLRQLEREYGVNRAKLSKKLEELGVKKTKGNHYRKYFHDFDYFEVIDSHEKAYWLGMFMSDGYISPPSFDKKRGKRYGEYSCGLAIQVEDIETLKNFKKAIKSTNPISIYTDKIKFDNYKEKWKKEFTYCRIILRSQKTADDLIDKNVVEKKSLIKEFPSFEKVPKKFIYSYVRGYMDGNGSIGIIECKTKQNSFALSFCTSKNFAKGLQAVLGGKLREDNREGIETWTLYFNTKESEEVLKKIYEDSTEETRMSRKYKRFITRSKTN